MKKMQTTWTLSSSNQKKKLFSYIVFSTIAIIDELSKFKIYHLKQFKLSTKRDCLNCAWDVWELYTKRCKIRHSAKRTFLDYNFVLVGDRNHCGRWVLDGKDSEACCSTGSYVMSFDRFYNVNLGPELSYRLGEIFWSSFRNAQRHSTCPFAPSSLLFVAALWRTDNFSTGIISLTAFQDVYWY